MAPDPAADDQSDGDARNARLHGPGPPAEPPEGPAPEPFRTLTEDLQALLDRAAAGPITIGQLIWTLRGRGMAMVVILLAAPFVLPLPLPVLSTPLGIAIGVLGLRLGFGLKPWLPKRVRRQRLDRDTLVRLVRATQRVARPIERLLSPRQPDLFARGLRTSAGLAIAAAAAILTLPLPFPGANAIPAFGIVLLAAGLMERDSAVTVAGHVVVLGAFAYLYLWWDLVATVLRRLVP